jgi:hypothetical protein
VRLAPRRAEADTRNVEPPEREDVLTIMRSLLRLNWKVDTILDVLRNDGEEEEEADT